MTCYLILNMWAGAWERQWAALYQEYKSICLLCRMVRAVILAGSVHNLKFVQGLEVDDVLVLDDIYYNPENVLIELEQNGDRNAVYIFGWGDYSHEMAVRLSARLDGDSLTAVKHLERGNGCIFARRNVYSDNMEGTFRMEQMPFCISLAKSSDMTVPQFTESAAPVRRINITQNSCCVTGYTEETVETDDTLEDAGILIVLGKGVRSKADYSEAEELAYIMGAKIGASRPLVMQGVAPLHSLVGASGAITHPGLCIAAGVSGAAAFYVGIEKSGYIIAINTDADAFIMSRADVAVNRDYREVFRALKEYLIKGGGPHDFTNGE